MAFGGPLECQNSTAPHILSFTTAAVSSLLMLITVPGNLLICVAVVRDPFKTLRTPFNLFLLNIAAADLVVGLGVLPLSVAYHTLEGMALYYPALVKTLHLGFFISCSASVLGIAALSLDRYICVTSPLKYRSRLKSSRVRKASLIIWLISVVCSFAYLYVDFIIYTFVFVNTAILFTLVILVFVNHKISRSLQSQRKLLQSLADGEIMESRLIQRDEKVTKTFLLFLGAFMVLTMPSLSLSYVLNFGLSCDCNWYQIFRDFQFVSILFPSSVNPFIYSLRLPNFRKVIKVVAYEMMPSILRKDSKISLFTSSLPDFGYLANQVFSAKTNAKLEETREPRGRFSNADPISMSSLQGVSTYFQSGTQTVDVEGYGISHFYRVTTNL